MFVPRRPRASARYAAPAEGHLRSRAQGTLEIAQKRRRGGTTSRCLTRVYLVRRVNLLSSMRVRAPQSGRDKPPAPAPSEAYQLTEFQTLQGGLKLRENVAWAYRTSSVLFARHRAPRRAH